MFGAGATLLRMSTPSSSRSSRAAARVETLARQTAGSLAAQPPARLSHHGKPSSTTPPPAPTFIDRVKASGAQALLGHLVTSERFDSTLEGLVVTDVNITAGTVTCEMVVTRAVSNTYGTLHGGAIATLVDLVGTMALLTRDPLRAGVSVDLNCSYLAAAKEGETVTIIGRALKVGKRLGFSEVELRRGKAGEGGALLATGRHTKAL
jgi:acyl-coenzyme A thioesterase 13